MSGAEAALATGGLLDCAGCPEAGQVSVLLAQEALTELAEMLALSPVLESKQAGK